MDFIHFKEHRYLQSQFDSYPLLITIITDYKPWGEWSSCRCNRIQWSKMKCREIACEVLSEPTKLATCEPDDDCEVAS